MSAKHRQMAADRKAARKQRMVPLHAAHAAAREVARMTRSKLLIAKAHVVAKEQAAAELRRS